MTTTAKLRNEVRVSDSDLEMLAIKAIAAALEPMEPHDRERVLRWAQAKYVDRHVSMLGDMEKAFMDLLVNIQQAAEKGGTSWPVLVRVVEEVLRAQNAEKQRLREAAEIAEATS